MHNAKMGPSVISRALKTFIVFGSLRKLTVGSRASIAGNLRLHALVLCILILNSTGDILLLASILLS